MTLDETVESYIGLVDMFFKQFLIYPYVKGNDGKVLNLKGEYLTPNSILIQRDAIRSHDWINQDDIKKYFIFVGDYLSGIVTRENVVSQTKDVVNKVEDFDSKFREYCLLQMQKYHSTRDEAMYTVSKLDEFTPFSYEVVGEEPNCKHILKYLKTGGIIEPIKR